MANYSNHTDEQLVTLLKYNNIAVLEEIYNRYWKKLYNSAYKRLNSPELCEEFVQEVFLNLWIKREVLSIEAGLSNYLYTAIRNSVIDFYRKELVRERYLASIPVTAFDNSTEESIHVRDLKSKIDHVVNLLPLKCRSVFMLSRAEHKTNPEIASILNISEKTVEGHLTKALKQLKSSLNHFLILASTLLINYFL
jgi:RNA polymerase sigma-70 factor (family 1)